MSATHRYMETLLGIIENTLNLTHLRNEEGGEDLAASQTCIRPWRREAPAQGEDEENHG